MSGWVTVRGIRLDICSRKSGTTEPDDPRTLPNLTAQNDVGEPCSFIAIIASSAARLVLPMTETGFTALSVEISTKRFTANSDESAASFLVASVLLRSPSCGFISTIGTCLYAAA